MYKPIKYSVAVILRSGRRPGSFLTVKRPHSDADMGGNWGLPAVTLQTDESPEDGARRVCKEKLGCTAEPIRFLGAMHQERNGYDLVLMDIEMILLGSDLPDVGAAVTTGTAYIEQLWADNPGVLLASAEHGSCCSSIFLADQGILSRDEWKLSLKGSSLVG
jgi:ADP-ribose pyrophosphatase YjhB (NUDIX family)